MNLFEILACPKCKTKLKIDNKNNKMECFNCCSIYDIIESIPSLLKVEEMDNFNILYVGGLTKHKGVHILISAVRQLQNRNIRLHIVGIGVHENKLKELAKDDKRIIFYGWLSENNVQKLYRIVNITVMPSICYEAFGLSILESLREGIPVIGSRIGAIPELIEDNYNGFLFKAGNINELKNILEDVISNPEKLKEISINTLKSVKNYEMSKHIERLEKIYEEAIKLNKER